VPQKYSVEKYSIMLKILLREPDTNCTLKTISWHYWQVFWFRYRINELFIR